MDDAPLDDDALDDLADEIATLAAHIHAATQRLLELIAEFDRCRGWQRLGHRTCAHWLSYRTGIDLGAAREKVRAARALTELPETSAAMARGELSFSKVRALTRVATPENESDLLELARGSTTAQLERMVRAWKVGSRDTEAELERIRHESRSFSVFPGEDGMYVIRGRLDPEVGALLMRAVEAAGDALYRSDQSSGTRSAADSETSRREAARRRADAVGLLAERAMAAGFGGAIAGSVTDGDPADDPDDTPVSGTRAERYQVFLHVDRETLSDGGVEEAHEVGRSHLEDGTRVSPETSRRLSCDAGVVRVDHDVDGSILDVGRRTRTIPPALRRALEVRDRGCRFPGCGLRFTDAHHVRHWADGGETSLANCILLCRYHHRLIHEGGWRVVMPRRSKVFRRPEVFRNPEVVVGRDEVALVPGPGEAPVFIDPRGGTHFEGRWQPPVLEGAMHEKGDAEVVLEGAPGATYHGGGTAASDEGGTAGNNGCDAAGNDGGGPAPRSPVERLVADNHRNGARPDGWTTCSRWTRKEDIPRKVYLRAREAVG